MRWEVEQTPTGWAVNGYSNERIRFHADGRLSIGESAPIESYPYLTREWAEYGLIAAKLLDPELVRESNE